MRLIDLLIEIRDLQFYDAEAWEEYGSYFEGLHVLPRCAARSLCPAGAALVRRIRDGVGAQPAVPDFSASPKIVTAEYLAAEDVRKTMTLGVVSGAFDLLHLGHLRFMKQAKEDLRGRPNGRLCAMVLSDEHIRQKKGDSRPVLGANARLTLLAAVRFIDYVIPLEEPDCRVAFQRLTPEVLFKFEVDLSQEVVRGEIDLVNSSGGDVQLLPPPKPRNLSTTSVIEAVKGRFAEMRGCD